MRQLVTTILIFTLFLTTFPFTKANASLDGNLLKEARKHIGVPYKFGGTTPRGFDCSGFIRYVFNSYGVDLPRTSNDQFDAGEKVGKADLQPGDLVFFANTYKSGISHVGIYIGNNEFIGASSSKGVAVDSLKSSYWGKHYVGAKRVFKPVLATLPDGQYHDVPKEHSAYTAVLDFGKKGIISGYENSFFKPDEPITREQAAVVINRILNLKSTGNVEMPDVPSSLSSAGHIAAVKEAGIINGNPDGTFGLKATLTRAELAIIIERAFGVANSSSGKTVEFPYKDVSTDSFAYNAIYNLYKMDTLKVFQSNTFNENNTVSRIEFTAAVYNAIQPNK